MSAEDLVSQIRRMPSPHVDMLGLQVQSATLEEVVATLTVDPAKHFHPWGAVHGGVYCSVTETLATIGAALSAIPEGRLAVGLENHTSFVRSVRGGELTARGVALNRGRQMHLWEVRIVDERERLVARGTVRLALIQPESS